MAASLSSKLCFNPSLSFASSTSLSKQCLSSRCEFFSNTQLLSHANKLICNKTANVLFQSKLVAPSASAAVEEIKKVFEKKEVSIDSGLGDLPRITLMNATGSSAEIYLYGGVVTSWKNCSGEDLLYVRPDAVFNGKKPISGGIPHCFPQFGPGEMQQHGFARNLVWEMVESKGGDSPSVVLKLSDSSYTRAMFDYSFENLFQITLDGEKLLTKLTVKNTGQKSFSFTTALHTYFKAVAADATVHGLQDLHFLNKHPDPTNPIPGVENREEVNFVEYVDTMYLDAPSQVFLNNGFKQTVKIESNAGWNDVVIWNPHLTMEACYKEFVCVENAKLKPVTLGPGEIWVAEQILSVS